MDSITVADLPKPGGMTRNWPQPYEITVVPPREVRMPELPFLHKGDEITLENGTTYLIAGARQVAVKTPLLSGSQWRWVYQATKQKPDNDELGDWDI